MVEHLTADQEVIGSIPIVPLLFLNYHLLCLLFDLEEAKSLLFFLSIIANKKSGKSQKDINYKNNILLILKTKSY